MTVDRAFVLGSDEQYREWGYTAMSRHRERTRYYLTEPPPYLNCEVSKTLSREGLVDAAARVFAGSRQQEMAIEAIERHPLAGKLLERIDERSRSVAEARGRAADLEVERERTSIFHRSARRELATGAALTHAGANHVDAELAELLQRFEGMTGSKSRGRGRARDPVALELVRERSRGRDRGPDLGM